MTNTLHPFCSVAPLAGFAVKVQNSKHLGGTPSENRRFLNIGRAPVPLGGLGMKDHL